MVILVLTEIRYARRENKNTFIFGNLNASRWIGETFVRLNTNFDVVEHLFTLVTRRVPQQTGNIARNQVIDKDSTEPVYEAGLDLERVLLPGLTGKMIFLLFRGYINRIETQQLLTTTGNQLLFRIADTYNVSTEGVSRLELDWSGIPGHALQLNLEGAYNLLDGKFNQTDDTGPALFSLMLLVRIPALRKPAAISF